jgi:hypothetical protein
MMSLGVHLRIIGRPGRIGSLERFIRHVKGYEGVWIATRAAIAEHWARANPPAEDGMTGRARRENPGPEGTRR